MPATSAPPALDEFQSGGVEKRHRKEACQIHPLRVEAHEDGESFNQVFAVVAVIERACPEEQRQRRVNRRRVTVVPNYSQAS
jgi:hypothetical protein